MQQRPSYERCIFARTLRWNGWPRVWRILLVWIFRTCPAFLASCWGTRLQDPAKPYESPSYLENLKQRDFESKPFEVTSGPDYRLHIVPSSLGAAQLTSNHFKGNKDGQDSLADEAIRAHKDMTVRKLQEHLASIGIRRGTTWVSKRRAALGISGVVRGEAAGTITDCSEESFSSLTLYVNVVRFVLLYRRERTKSEAVACSRGLYAVLYAHRLIGTRVKRGLLKMSGSVCLEPSADQNFTQTHYFRNWGFTTCPITRIAVELFLV